MSGRWLVDSGLNEVEAPSIAIVVLGHYFRWTWINGIQRAGAPVRSQRKIERNMAPYEMIQRLIAQKYGKPTLSKKNIGDFMLSDTHAVNVKSNNVDKKNYSPNMLSIQQMHEWVYERRNQLSFIFVDYRESGNELEVLTETDLIPIEHINWDCLTIEAQGYGVIQKPKPLAIVESQTKRDFYLGFLKAYDKYRLKELKKHEKFSSRFIKDVDSINW